MKKIILFLMVLCVGASAQQLNYTFGYDAVGNALTGSFTAVDTTGATDYTIIIKLDDYYPYDYNPAQYDSVTGLNGSADHTIGSIWFYWDVFAATDSCSFDVDAYAGVYGDANRTVAGVKWDATAVEVHNQTGTKGDVCDVARVYVEASAGKVLPPEIIKLVFDMDSIGNTDDAVNGVGSNAFYYRFVYPAIYQIHKERR